MDIIDIQSKQQKMIIKKQIESDSKHTPIKYNTAFNSFNTYMKQSNITNINQENINDVLLQYLKYLKDMQLTKNTIKQYMILINNFLKNECKYQIDYIKLPKPEKHKPKYIDVTQYQEVMQHLKNERSKTSTFHQKKIIDTDITIINLLFNTGLRIHEALKITIDEIQKIKDTKEYELYDLDVYGKGNKERTIYIPSNTYNILIEYIKEYSSPEQIFIFESNKEPGTPITTMTIERHFKKIAKELDAINDTAADDKNSYQTLLKPHNLRHSYAVVKTTEKGLSINTLQELLGHANITTTQIYTKVNNKEVKKALAKTI